MQTTGDEVHADVEEARAASTPNVVRWVLIISLLAAIILLTAIWVIGAWSSDQNNQTADAQIRAAQENRQNDSIVSDKADRMNATTAGESTEPQNTPNKNAGQ
jgi:type II secretory pathway pseudopilin PulG